MVSDQKSHASRHSDGGSDELDAADLAGGLGSSGQLLQSDGSAASWVDFQSGSDVSDDGTLVVSAPSDVNFGNQLDVTDDGDGTVTVETSAGGITASAPLTTLASEESITLMRTKVPSGKTVEVYQAVVADDNGDSIANETEIELFNHTDGTTEYVVDTDTLQQGEPLYSGSQGDDIEVRLVNASNSQKNLAGQILLNVV